MYARHGTNFGEVVDERSHLVISNGRQETWEKIHPVSDTEYRMMTTTKIQVRVQGGRHKMWHSLLHSFDHVDDAHAYIKELLQDDETTNSEFGIKTKHFEVTTNYPVLLIDARTPHTGRLHDIATTPDTSRKFVRPSSSSGRHYDRGDEQQTPQREEKPSRKESRSKDAASYVQLKDMCKQHDLDARRVRKWLRSQSKIHKRSGWEFTKDEVEVILAALGKKS